MLNACRPIDLYLQADNPVFISNHIIPRSSIDTISVINYNIEYGKHTIEASQWLSEHLNPKYSQIIFLQELCEKDVEYMAEVLDLNYLYIPISFEEKKNKNFGNGILTNWEITRYKKVLLKHSKPFNGRRRSATYGLLKYEDQYIHAYSTHLETIIMPPKKRKEQLASLVADINSDKDSDMILIGGDFNCISNDMRQAYTSALEEIDVKEYTKDIQATAQILFGIPVTLDLVYGKGFNVHDQQTHSHHNWSDHAAVELTLVIDR